MEFSKIDFRLLSYQVICVQENKTLGNPTLQNFVQIANEGRLYAKGQYGKFNVTKPFQIVILDKRVFYKFSENTWSPRSSILKICITGPIRLHAIFCIFKILLTN